MSRYFVIKEIGCEDSTPYAVVERRPMLNGPDHLVLFGRWPTLKIRPAPRRTTSTTRSISP